MSGGALNQAHLQVRDVRIPPDVASLIGTDSIPSVAAAYHDKSAKELAKACRDPASAPGWRSDDAFFCWADSLAAAAIRECEARRGVCGSWSNEQSKKVAQASREYDLIRSMRSWVR